MGSYTFRWYVPPLPHAAMRCPTRDPLAEAGVTLGGAVAQLPAWSRAVLHPCLGKIESATARLLDHKS